MLLEQLKQEAIKLPPSERLSLVSVIVESLKENAVSQVERSSAISRMRGFLKTDNPAPTDDEVATMLDERRMEKYQT
ncbi:MAG: hypothetical protein ABG776_16780 [Cyanobacteria bacterium J06555_13]